MDFSGVDLRRLYFRKTIDKDLGEVSMDADMVRLLVAVEPDRDAVSIARRIGLTPAALKRALTRLLQLGLIEADPRAEAVLAPSFLRVLKTELARAVGPIGELVLEEVTAAMNLSPGRIPVSQAAELIVHLAREIPDSRHRLAFQTAMRAHLPT